MRHNRRQEKRKSEERVRQKTKAMEEFLATGYHFGNASPAPTALISSSPEVASPKTDAAK